jgi:very-short-patch-repair endonuclease
VDAVFPRERLIVELDGWETHRDRRSFENDRERDAATLAAGYATVRVTWDRFHDAAVREAGRLHEILRLRRESG